MIRKIVYAVFALIIISALLLFLYSFPFGEDKKDIANYYIQRTESDLGAANVVTAVTLFYRGLDTLGEVTILFTAAIGISIILFNEKRKKRAVRDSDFITRTGSRIVFPFIILTGAYITLHGHITPGGGFQGGALIATGFLLLYLARDNFEIDRKKFMLVEGVGGMIYIIVGLIGLFTKGSFLANFLPAGTLFSLLSGGILLPIYIGVGLKVGSEFAGIVDDMMCEARCEGGES